MKHYRPTGFASRPTEITAAETAEFFVPADVALAHRMFKANCGPAALAAVLKRRVCDVMEFFPQFPERPWTTQTQMGDALDGLGIDASLDRETLPLQGVALLQFAGPWLRPGMPKVVHLKHTHWVGIQNKFIYDVNASAWLRLAEWERRIFPRIAESHPGCSGWSVKVGFEFERVQPLSLAAPRVTCDFGFDSQPTAYSR